MALRHDVVPSGRRVGSRTPLEGVAVLFRGRWRGGGTGVGGTVSLNDNGLPAQHPHSTGDGHTMRVGRTAPRMIPRRCQRAGVAEIHL
jgi:hypothetical protein